MTRKQTTVASHSAILCLIAMGIITTTAQGCGNRSEATVASNAAQPTAVASASDDEKVKKFLADLEAQPADKRNGYVSAHQNEANMASQNKNPEISQKFYSLMMPKLVMPER